MARPIRIEFAGAVYHVMARGNHGQPVFGEDDDRKLFLETLGKPARRPAGAFTLTCYGLFSERTFGEIGIARVLAS